MKTANIQPEIEQGACQFKDQYIGHIRVYTYSAGARKQRRFLFIASSGPGETDAKGLIVPKFGKTPENHVIVNMSFKSFSELLLMTKMHYQMWLASWYVHNPIQPASRQQAQSTQSNSSGDPPVQMF